MKGREAVRSAQRREAVAVAKVEELQRQLGSERAAAKAEVVKLEEEIRRLKTEHMAEASALAAREVERILAKAEEARRQKGLSDDIVTHFMYQKDKFIRNACRYVSMTTGRNPRQAFALVATWITEKDFWGMGKVDRLIDMGVPGDGWVATFLLKHRQYYERVFTRNNRVIGESEAMSLDRAEAEGHEAIHPKYNPRWYPPIEYGGIEVVNEVFDQQEGDA